MKEGMESLPKFEHGPSVTWGGYYLGTCRLPMRESPIIHALSTRITTVAYSLLTQSYERKFLTASGPPLQKDRHMTANKHYAYMYGSLPEKAPTIPPA